MPNSDLFSKFKNPENIKVSVFRKMRHSLTNKISSSTKKDLGVIAIEQGSAAAGVVTFGASCAVAAGSAAAFAAAMTGPQAGVALGLLGIVLAAKAVYSDREKAHNAITPYMFSLIDDARPTPLPTDKAQLEKLGGAALTLITDGQAQVSQGQAKLTSAEAAFYAWLSSYDLITKSHNNYLKFRTLGHQQSVLQNEAKRQDLITKAEKPGGAIFDYMRRLVHFGNYMQVFEFFGKVLKNDTGTWSEDVAFGSYATTVRSKRKELAEIVARIDSHTAAFDQANQ